MKKKVWILIIAIILVVAIVAGVKSRKKETTNNANQGASEEKYVEVLEDGTKVNKSNKLSEAKKVGNFEISDIKLSDKQGLSTLTATAKNTSSTKTKLCELEITLVDDQKNTLGKIKGMLMPVEPGQTTKLTTQVTDDYANAYDFSVEIIKEVD